MQDSVSSIAATRTPAHSIAPANCPEIWLPSQGRMCAKAPTGGREIDAGDPVLIEVVDPAEERHEVVQRVSLDGRAVRGEQGEA